LFAQLDYFLPTQAEAQENLLLLLVPLLVVLLLLLLLPLLHQIPSASLPILHRRRRHSVAQRTQRLLFFAHSTLKILDMNQRPRRAPCGRQRQLPSHTLPQAPEA
jgi:hypothetical protein